MNASPCLECPFKDKDKNNRACRNCKKRMAYVHGLQKYLEFTASYAGEHTHALRITS